MFRTDLLRWLGARLRPGRAATCVGGEAILRSTPSYSIAALWINVLADQGIRARSASDPGASFMGDGGEHGVIVGADQARKRPAVASKVQTIGG